MERKDLSWSYRKDGKEFVLKLAEWLLDMNILLHRKNPKPSHCFCWTEYEKNYGTLKHFILE